MTPSRWEPQADQIPRASMPHSQPGVDFAAPYNEIWHLQKQKDATVRNYNTVTHSLMTTRSSRTIFEIIKCRSRAKTSFGGLPLLLWRHVFYIIKCIPIIRQVDYGWIHRIILSHQERLSKRVKIGGEPVNSKTGRHLKRKESNHERQKLENALAPFKIILLFLTHGIIVAYSRRQDAHCQRLSQDQYNWHDEKGKCRFPSQRRSGEAIHVGPPLCKPVQATIVWRSNGTFQ